MNNNLTVNDYLDNLEVDKNKLINSISLINDTVESTDTFTQVIPKINNIEDTITNECFVTDKTQLDELTFMPTIKLGFLKLIKELPDTIALPFQVSANNGGALSYYTGSKIPVITNADECTNASSFFSNCSGLKEVTDFSLLNAEKAGAMFYSSSVEKVKNLNLPKTKTVVSFFDMCRRLQEIGTLTFPLATSFADFCSADSMLVTVGRLTSNQHIESMRQAFYNCSKLQSLDLGGLIIDENTDITDMFRSVPISCQITVRDQKSYDTISAVYPSYTYTIKDLEGISLNAFTNLINKSVHNTIQLETLYNGGPSTQQGVTYSITGNATIDNTGLVTLTEATQAGDIITVTATSTYNSNLTTTYTITVYDVERSLDVNLNEQFVDTTELVDSNKLYNVSTMVRIPDTSQYKTAISNITLKGYSKFTIYLRLNEAQTRINIAAYELDQTPDTSNPTLNQVFQVPEWQLNNNYYKYTYEIEDPTIEHTINIMAYLPVNYSSITNGYFYIAESECD